MISRGYAGLPMLARGQRIGLFGGSFNPPHEGHRAASLMALRRLRLDWIWWLVTPGNPFKDLHDLPAVAERIEAACNVAEHPRIVVTGVEERLGSRYTVDIVELLVGRYPTVRFVLIIGADSFVDLYRWRDWSRLVRLVPLAVIDRPGSTLTATRGHTAEALRGCRVREADAGSLADRQAPAYVFLHGPRSTLSSTELRREEPLN